MSIAQASREAAAALLGLNFAPPVACVYDPLDYAWDVHLQYLQKYGTGTREVLLVGMNPGPFGMVQTGIPFGGNVAPGAWISTLYIGELWAWWVGVVSRKATRRPPICTKSQSASGWPGRALIRINSVPV